MKAIILFVALGFAACNAADSNSKVTANTPTTPSPTVAQRGDGVRRITTAELDELMKQGKVIVLDVRNKDMYDLSHIRGAKLIPINQIGERANELPRDKMIVTYCS